MRRVLAAALAALFATADIAVAQESRLVQGPRYGTVRRALGETLLLAEQKPNCPANAQLAPNLCFDEAIAAMRSSRLTSASAIALGPVGAVRNEIYDLSANGSAYTATLREDGRSGVLVPRNCFALPNEGVRYEVTRLPNARAALESQLIVCDGAAPPQPWRASGASIPAAPLALGAANSAAEPTWPPTSTPTLRGDPAPFASSNPACPAEAVLRDRLCYAAPIAQLEADPNLREVSVLGANVQAQAGMTVQRVDQYVVRQRRNRVTVDERWFDRSLVATPDGCSNTGAAEYLISENAGAFFATPIQRARCGPPLAPAPVAVYEFYGNETFLVTPGSCAQEARLRGGDACFSQVMAYMRQTGQRDVQVVSLDGNYAPSTVVPFRGGGRIRYDVLIVTASPDFTQFGAHETRRYNAGVRPAGGCRLPQEWIPGSEGVIVSGGNRGRFFTWYECPAG